MAKIKDADIKKLFTTKQEFISALRKVSQRVEKPTIEEEVSKSG